MTLGKHGERGLFISVNSQGASIQWWFIRRLGYFGLTLWFQPRLRLVGIGRWETKRTKARHRSLQD